MGELFPNGEDENISPSNGSNDPKEIEDVYLEAMEDSEKPQEEPDKARDESKRCLQK